MKSSFHRLGVLFVVLVWVLVQAIPAYALCRCASTSTDGPSVECCCAPQEEPAEAPSEGGCCQSESQQTDRSDPTGRSAVAKACHTEAGSSGQGCAGSKMLQARSACCSGLSAEITTLPSPGAQESVEAASRCATLLIVGLLDWSPEPSILLERERGPDPLPCDEVPVYLRVSHLLI